MNRFFHLSLLQIAAAILVLAACPQDPPDVGECGVDSCYPPCIAGDCELPGDVCLDLGDASVCVPECAGSTCPETGECVYNPDSDPAPCSSTSSCTDPDAECVENQAGDLVCLLPPSHCVAFCEAAMDCPRGLECVDGICAYP